MGKTLALTLIVKNEQAVIKRCLDSVKHLIDYWVIIDTGSTDKTKAIIKKTMGDIPGELLESKFVSFSHNRTEYLDAVRGKADYCISLDADEVVIDNGFDKDSLTHDGYSISFNGEIEHWYPRLLKASLPWRYDYVIHEIPVCDLVTSVGTLDTLQIEHKHDNGHGSIRVDQNLALALNGIKEKPDDSRYAFYLANSYWDAGDYKDAQKWYDHRQRQGGWCEEMYFSMIRGALCAQLIDNKIGHFYVSRLEEANRYLPIRQEALYYLGVYYCNQKDYGRAFNYLSAAKMLPYPKGALFFQKAIYVYLIDLWLAVAMYWIGLYKEARDLNIVVLEKGYEVELVKKNLAFCDEKLLNQ